MIFAKDCEFYVGHRECSALKEQNCYQCPFYKAKKAVDVEEAIRLYAIRKEQRDNITRSKA